MKLTDKIIVFLYPAFFIKLWKRCLHKVRNIHYSSKFKNIGERVNFDNVKFLVGAQYISIGDDTCFGTDLYLTAWKFDSQTPCLEIGRNCSFGSWNHLSASNRIVIGDGLLTGKWVTIVDNSHGTTEIKDLQIRPWLRKVVSKGPVIIEKNVWIGDKVTILPNVTIGEGSVIAANTVVTKNVPPYCIFGGNPGIIIKQLKNENS